MGNSQFQPSSRQTTATGVFSRGYVENKGVKLAPQVGFEPTTLRLTAEWLVAASRCNQKAYRFIMPVFAEIGGTLGDSPRHPMNGAGRVFCGDRIVAACGAQWLFPDRRFRGT